MPCRIIFAKPEDLEMWPDHTNFHFLTKRQLFIFSNGCLADMDERPIEIMSCFFYPLLSTYSFFLLLCPVECVSE